MRLWSKAHIQGEHSGQLCAVMPTSIGTVAEASDEAMAGSLGVHWLSFGASSCPHWSQRGAPTSNSPHWSSLGASSALDQLVTVLVATSAAPLEKLLLARRKGYA